MALLAGVCRWLDLSYLIDGRSMRISELKAAGSMSKGDSYIRRFLKATQRSRLVIEQSGGTFLEYAFKVALIALFVSGSVYGVGIGINRTVCKSMDGFTSLSFIQYGQVPTGEWFCLGLDDVTGTYHDAFQNQIFDECEYYQCPPG